MSHDHDHGHSHSHDHGAHDKPPPKAPANASDRKAEDGGDAIQLDLEVVLPGERDERGRFERLAEALRPMRGVREVHLRNDQGKLEICVHHDPNLLVPARLIAALQAEGAAVATRYRERTWFIHGMDSAQSGFGIEAAVGKLPGVLTVSVAYAAERLVVEYDSQTTEPAKIAEAVKGLGYKLEEPVHGKACAHDHGSGGGLAPKLEIPLALTSGVLIGAGLLVGPLGLPEIVGSVLFIGATIAGGALPVKTALGSVRQLQFDIETLMVLAAVGAGVMGAWFEAAALLFLFSLGHALEHRAMERARGAIEALGKLRPEKARVRRGADVVELPIEEVVRGDIVVVRPGDRLPADGTVKDGQSSIDQSSITGESIPVPKQSGDPVYAGTLNGDGQLDVEVTRASTESMIAKVVDMVAQAEAQKSPTQRFTQRFERRAVPVVVLAAVVLPAILIALGTGPYDAALRGISLLVAASPCALAISTPAAVLSAVARAARDGVLFKGGAHLDALAGVTSIAFDKTGTLTVGRPALVAVEVGEGVGEDLLLSTAAGAESLSSHPIATAIVNGAKERGFAPLTASDSSIVHGRGIRATVDGDAVSIGSLAMFDRAPAWVATAVEKLEVAGKTTMIVQRGDRYLGVLGVADTVRREAIAALASLKQLGIARTVMLSGDNQRVAAAIAKAVGIDQPLAPLMPEGKVAALKEMAASGPTAMVGDGVNDAPALASASVGVAMGGVGSDVALQTADVVLMSEDLRKLPWAIELARASRTVIRQNLAISFGVSAVLIVSAVFGWTGMGSAMLFHEGSTLIVAANGIRLLAFRGAQPVGGTA